MSEPYIGQIIAAGFNFPPVGWVTCNGQLLQINDYPTLFSLIGTTYGGDGATTFGVPDLRGRSPLGSGQGGGFSNYTLGQAGGAEQVTLNGNQIPAHSHLVNVSSAPGTGDTPGSGAFLASEGPASPAPSVFAYEAYDANNQTTLAGGTIGPTGQQGPHDNRQPYLTINYIIATDGVYPPRN